MNGFRWQDTPQVYGPHRTLYNRFVQWLRLWVFAHIFRELACPGSDGDTLMMGIEPVVRHWSKDRRRGHLKAYRTAASLAQGGARHQAIGCTKGGLNSKLHMVSDGRSRPLTFLLSPGQMSDVKGALGLLAEMPLGPRGLSLGGEAPRARAGSTK